MVEDRSLAVSRLEAMMQAANLMQPAWMSSMPR
jgi:hypothetical protein